jgi:hypothetical protein
MVDRIAGARDSITFVSSPSSRQRELRGPA